MSESPGWSINVLKSLICKCEGGVLLLVFTLAGITNYLNFYFPTTKGKIKCFQSRHCQSVYCVTQSIMLMEQSMQSLQMFPIKPLLWVSQNIIKQSMQSFQMFPIKQLLWVSQNIIKITDLSPSFNIALLLALQNSIWTQGCTHLWILAFLLKD